MYLQSCAVDFRVDRDYWVRSITELVTNVSDACQWLMDLLCSDKGPNYLKYVQCMMYVVNMLA